MIMVMGIVMFSIGMMLVLNDKSIGWLLLIIGIILTFGNFLFT